MLKAMLTLFADSYTKRSSFWIIVGTFTATALGVGLGIKYLFPPLGLRARVVLVRDIEDDDEDHEDNDDDRLFLGDQEQNPDIDEFLEEDGENDGKGEYYDEDGGHDWDDDSSWFENSEDNSMDNGNQDDQNTHNDWINQVD